MKNIVTKNVVIIPFVLVFIIALMPIQVYAFHLSAPDANNLYGYVKNTAGDFMGGVTVHCSGPSTNKDVTTSASGYYSCGLVPDGSFTLTPTYTGWGFNPSSRTVTVSGAPLQAGDFIGSQIGNNLYGYVKNTAGDSMGGVSVHCSGPSTNKDVTTSVSGYYSCGLVPNGSFTLAPTYVGWVFNPSSRTVTVSGAPVQAGDFIGSTGGDKNLYGYVKNTAGDFMGGVTVHCSGPSTNKDVTTSVSGYYSCGLVPDGSFTLTPTYAGWGFNPSSRTVTVSGASLQVGDFIGTMETYSIQGRVTDSSGSPLSGVTVSTGEGHTTITLADGTYTLPDLTSGTYPITPSLPNYTFNPVSQSVTLPPTVTNINFIGVHTNWILAVTASPASPGNGMVGLNFPITVDVGTDVNQNSALDVTLYRNSIYIDNECKDIVGMQIVNERFYLDVVENTTGFKEYMIEAHLQAGSSCPITQSIVDDDIKSIPYQINWIINQKPIISLISPPSPINNSTINYDDVTIKWQGNDSDGNVQGYEYEIDGNGFSTAETNIVIDNLAETIHTFRVRCFDDKGAYSDWDSINFTISLKPYITSVKANRSDEFGPSHSILSKYTFLQGQGFSDVFVRGDELDNSRSSLMFLKESFWVDIDIENPLSQTQSGLITAKIRYPDGNLYDMKPWWTGSGWNISVPSNTSYRISIPIVPVKNVPITEGEYQLYFRFSDEFDLSTPDLTFLVTNTQILPPENLEPGKLIALNFSNYQLPSDSPEITRIDQYNLAIQGLYWTFYSWILIRGGAIPELDPNIKPDGLPMLEQFPDDINSSERAAITTSADNDLNLISREGNKSTFKAKWQNIGYYYDVGGYTISGHLNFDRVTNTIDIKVEPNVDCPIILTPQSAANNQICALEKDQNGQIKAKHTITVWWSYHTDKQIINYGWNEEQIEISHITDIDVDYSVSFDWGPYRGIPGINSDGAVIDYAKWHNTPNAMYWIAISSHQSHASSKGFGLQEVYGQNLSMNKPGQIIVDVVSPEDGNFYVKIFDDNLGGPRWSLNPADSSLIQLSKGEEHLFTFNVTPDTASEEFQVWLYRQSWIPFVFPIVDKVIVTLRVPNTPMCFPLAPDYTGTGQTPTLVPANSPGCPNGEYTAEQSITVTAHPADGYHVGSWQGTISNVSTSPQNTVIMPANNHPVLANYVPNTLTCYALTADYTGMGQVPTLTPVNSSECPAGNYIAGQSIIITAYPGTGYHVGSWQGTIANFSTSIANTISMPSEEHTATVNYVQDVLTLPDVEVRNKYNGRVIPSGDTLPIKSDGTDFGTINIANDTVQHTFRIYNTGDSNLILTGNPEVVVLGTNGTSSANFSVNPQPNSPVSAGNYTEFVVTFDPSAAGLRIATLSIANNDSNKNPYTFSIQGKGSSAPVALGDTYTTDEDKVLTVAVPGVLANDSDAENDPLSAILVSGVTHGKLTPNPSGSFTYTPTVNFNGTDSFTYKTNDEALDSNTALVTITVNAINDAPVAAEDAYFVPENKILTIAAPGILMNDSDVENDPLSASLVSGVTHGTLALNSDGSFTYTQTASYSGPDSFTYKVSDGSLESNAATVSLQVQQDAIFKDGFESGSLSAWSSSVGGSGDLSANAASALIGGKGLELRINDNSPVYLVDTSPTAEAHYRARFYFNPGTLVMTNGDAHTIFYGYRPTGVGLFQITLYHNNNGYQVRIGVVDDAATTWKYNSYTPLTNATHYFELEWQAATGVGANNGVMNFWVDGVQKGNITGLDTDTCRVETVRLGAITGIDTGTRGSDYFDAFESRRQSYIGEGGVRADFSAYPRLGTRPLAVSFTSLSGPADKIEAYLWDFGDGENSTEANPTHIYKVGGDFTVSLIVAGDGDQKIATKVGYIHVVVPDLLFKDGFEAGTLGSWSSTVGGSGDLSVNTTAALVGGKGLQLRIDDNSPVYLVDISPTAEAHYRARFYFNPSSMVMANGDAHTIFYGYRPTGVGLFQITLYYLNNGYQVRIGVVDDAGTTWKYSSYTPLTNASHFFEIEWQAATGEGLNNGLMLFYVDGAQKGNLGGLDTDTCRLETVRLGAITGIDPGTRGSDYFDAFESRTQSYIGEGGVRADFSASQTTGLTPLTVSFTSLSGPVDKIEAYLWDFGDGSPTSSIANPIHTYTSGGDFTVSLIVAGDGDQKTATKAGYIHAFADLIFKDGFESGSLSAWSSSVGGSGDLTVNATAALVGGKGLELRINDNSPVYLVDTSPTAEAHYRARFYFNPGTLVMANGDAHTIFYGYRPTGVGLFQITLYYKNGYQVRIGVVDDAATTWKYNSYTPITNTIHFFELEWQAATGVGANNGVMNFWVDGIQRGNLTVLDTDTCRVETVRLGAITGIDTGTRGSYYFDAFESHRINFIGP